MKYLAFVSASAQKPGRENKQLSFLDRLCLDGIISAICFCCSCLLFHSLSCTLVVLSVKQINLFVYLWSFFTFKVCSHGCFSFPLRLRVFPGASSHASILFSRQSSFYPCSVWCPPVGSAFHHAACSQESPVTLGRPAEPLIAHVTCSRRALARRGERKTRSNSESTAEASLLLQALSERRIRPPGGFAVWPLWNGPRWQETACVTQELTTGKWDASGGRPVERRDTSYSVLWADTAGGVLPFNFLLLCRHDKWWSVMWGDLWTAGIQTCKAWRRWMTHGGVQYIYSSTSHWL